MTSQLEQAGQDIARAVRHRALDLLKRYDSAAKPDEVQLEIAFGAAQEIEVVGLDPRLVPVRLDDLAAFPSCGHGETLKRDVISRLEQAIAGRPVGAILVLDAIEHFADGDAILQAVAEIARKYFAPVVVSAPNVTHRDIGAKLAFGRWDYTRGGLLDLAHLRFFDQDSLTAAVEKAGLAIVERRDLAGPGSDQHFPATHPALAAGTPLNGLLFEAARRSNPSSAVAQFVWLCVPAREIAREVFLTDRDGPRPLVSAIMRTQARRLHTMIEALTCLAGQTDPDFELIVITHKIGPEEIRKVERVIEDTPDWLRKKIRLLHADDGGRSRPLNMAFAAARGRYISILDDDDIPFANWVAEYRRLDAQSPGRVLRCASVRQDVENVRINKKTGLRADGPPEQFYPAQFNFLEHLVENASPPITLAFPRGAFHDLGLRFDESLDTTEDWDFLLAASSYCGVASSPEITGVYRWWTNHESSRTQHSAQEWEMNHAAILRKQDQGYFIVPKGGLAEIRRLVSDNKRLRDEARRARKFDHDSRNAHSVAVKEVEPHTFAFGPTGPRLDSFEDAASWGRALSEILPGDLARAMRKGIRRKYVGLQLRYWLVYLSRRKRRQIRSRLRVYRFFLEQFR